MSHDDADPFGLPYIAQENPKEAPTVSIDTTGALRLMQMCCDDARPTIRTSSWASPRTGRRARDSVKFCNTLGLTYVSRRPKRVPVARLAAAQAALSK